MWLWILAVVTAFYVKGLCGFANTLVFTSVLSFGVNNINISPVELLLGYPSNIILVWKNRSKLRASIYIPLSLLLLLGSVPGAFILKNMDVRYVKIFFAFVVIGLGIEMFLREKNILFFNHSKLFICIIGFLSGLLCGLFGVGALLAAYVGRLAKTGDEFKANISAVFMVENTFRIILYCALGIFSFSIFKQAIILLPFMFLGLFAGIRSSCFFEEKKVKMLVIILLVVSGVIMIISNV